MCNELWTRLMELQPLIRKCARRIAWQYDEDADEIMSRMMSTLTDKAVQTPSLLDRPDVYLAQIAKNAIHRYYQHLFGWKLQRHMIALDDIELADDEDVTDDLERQERIEAVRFALEHMDDECRELVRAILDNDDLIRNSRCKRSDRPCRNMINVSALARRMGRPGRSVARDVSRLRSKLASSLAFA